MTLYLLPNKLHEDADPAAVFVPMMRDIVNDLDGFFVENEKVARKMLSNFDFQKLKTKPMIVLDKRAQDIASLLDEIREGQKWGVISDAGLPCIADPGAELVFAAKKRNMSVKTFPGPSSIVLALMLSGLNSQEFYFGGYLPRKITPSLRRLKMTQVFIETPYNNTKSLRDLLHVLHDNDYLCVAVDLTSDTEQVVTQSVSEWKKNFSQFDFHKRPALFVLKISP